MSIVTSPVGVAPRAISTKRRCSSMRQAARQKASAAWLQVGDGSHLELHHSPWWRHLYRDFRRYRVTADPPLRTVFLTQGFWASCVYRLSRALLGRTRLARPLVPPARELLELITSINLSTDAEIGEGLYIVQYGCIILPPECRIGPNCSLPQTIT